MLTQRPRGGRPPVVDASPERRTLHPDLARQLDLARRRLGLSIRELADRASISRSMAGYLVTGERVPSVEVAERVAEVLRLDDNTYEALLDAAVVRGWSQGVVAEVVLTSPMTRLPLPIRRRVTWRC